MAEDVVEWMGKIPATTAGICGFVRVTSLTKICADNGIDIGNVYFSSEACMDAERKSDVARISDDDLIAAAVSLARAEKAVKAANDDLEKRRKAVTAEIAERFRATKKQSVKAHGATLSLRLDYRPAFDFDGYRNSLPDEIRNDSEALEAAMKTADAALREKILAALKDDPELSTCVAEQFNWNSLRSRILGTEETYIDADGDAAPKVPDVISGLIRMDKQPSVNVTGIK